MPIHPSLPKTLTKENLAKWITENCIDKKMHEERIDLDAEQIRDLEHRSSAASRQIDKLESQQLEIKGHFVDGTTEPIHITIPFTKGLKALKANRSFADDAIELGYTREETVLFGIPYPEKEVVIFVDAEGTEYPSYQEKMTPEQSRAYNTMFKEPSLKEQVSQQQKSKAKNELTTKEKKTLGARTERVAPKEDDELPPSDLGSSLLDGE